MWLIHVNFKDMYSVNLVNAFHGNLLLIQNTLRCTWLCKHSSKVKVVMEWFVILIENPPLVTEMSVWTYLLLTILIKYSSLCMKEAELSKLSCNLHWIFIARFAVHEFIQVNKVTTAALETLTPHGAIISSSRCKKGEIRGIQLMVNEEYQRRLTPISIPIP